MEKIILISYAGIWFLLHLLSRLFLDMYTSSEPPGYLTVAAIVITPIAIYAALRTMFSKNEKWYRAIIYFVAYLALGIFTSEYIIVNGDLLLSMTTIPGKTVEVPVLNVHKVIKRKLGFDHTAVTLLIEGKPIEMEARPYTYFFLKDKKVLRIISRKSSLGNNYVTYIELKGGERGLARWLHFKDWLYRYRLLWAVLTGFIVIIWIAIVWFPVKTQRKPVRIGFWKTMGIVMGILVGIAALLYAALLIYVRFKL
ncbi:hypothetical protein [Pedobacter sp. D749]|uniref:hypothetical protein n=1 Tax=Pedobacter sp. D749 TaxID=2856523 RepID=UPI001C55DB7D|nr:hypothetical protein [Pedobacter sp. D749]QXU42933.1 hypothetical protein KYH19_04855 [Pedobacter sp. D749]